MKNHFDQACASVEALDPRVRRTRKLLQDALRALVHERPFSTITVQDIADRATVNRATFYAHYLDKYDLIASIFKTDLHITIEQRMANHMALTSENLVVFAVAIFDFLGEIYASCPKTANDFQETIGTTLQEELYEIMFGWLSRSGNYAHLFPKGSKETLATVLVGSIYGGAYRWSRSSPRLPAAEVCREIVSILVVGENSARK